MSGDVEGIIDTVEVISSIRQAKEEGNLIWRYWVTGTGFASADHPLTKPLFWVRADLPGIGGLVKNTVRPGRAGYRMGRGHRTLDSIQPSRRVAHTVRRPAGANPATVPLQATRNDIQMVQLVKLEDMVKKAIIQISNLKKKLSEAESVVQHYAKDETYQGDWYGGQKRKGQIILVRFNYSPTAKRYLKAQRGRAGFYDHI